MVSEHDSTLIDHYGAMVEQCLANGWAAYLLTFEFDRLRGAKWDKCDEMEKEAERVYATLLTRVLHKPKAQSAAGKRPIFILLPDYPRPDKKEAEQS